MSYGFYAFAWLTLLLPLLGGLSSFVAETPRRAAHICIAFTGLSLAVALAVLGFRLTHYRTSMNPDESLITFLSLRPDSSELAIFPTDLHPHVGVRVDNLSSGFMALITFLALVVQVQASVVLRGDSAYRRYFWASSVLTTGLLALAASPSLFQTWLAAGMISATTLVLSLHWWQRAGAAAAARRGFLVLLAADLCVLLALVVQIARLGVFTGNLPPPANQDGVSDPYSYGLVTKAWDAVHAATVNGVGGRTLAIVALLFIAAALLHAAQAPLTGWITGLIEAPLPVLAMLGVSLLSGVLMLARVYPLLLDAPHVLSVLAVVAALGALGLSGLCLLTRDIYRLAVLSTAAQLALAFTAFGLGGYSQGLLIAFVVAPISMLLFVVAGSLVRSYRTRDILEMGGAWQRMPRTGVGLGAWAIAVGGADLAGYDVLSAGLRNRFPNAGHVAGWVAALVIVLTLAALLLTAAYAFRLLFTVCAGETVRRRGFAVERIVEAEPRMRRLMITLITASVVAIIVGIPGVSGFNLGHTRVPGLTFSHWIFLGGIRQVLAFNPWALAIAVAVLVVGGLAGRAVGTAERADLASRLGALRRIPVAMVRERALQVGATATAVVVAVDDSFIEPLLDAPAEGIAVAAAPLARARVRRLGVGLAAVLIVVLVLVGASVLAAGGQLPVHTT